METYTSAEQSFVLYRVNTECDEWALTKGGSLFFQGCCQLNITQDIAGTLKPDTCGCVCMHVCSVSYCTWEAETEGQFEHRSLTPTWVT